MTTVCQQESLIFELGINFKRRNFYVLLLLAILVQLFYVMKIKDDFHHLINNDQNGHLWNSLKEDEKEELLAAYKESF